MIQVSKKIKNQLKILLLLDSKKTIRNHSALNFVHFHKNIYESPINDDSLLENKIKKSFLPENIHAFQNISHKKKSHLQENDKNGISEKDKIKIHKTFYESFRLINPNGMERNTIYKETSNNLDKILNNSENNNEIKAIKEEELDNFDFYGDFTSKLNDEKFEKYSYAPLIKNYSLVLLLKKVFLENLNEDHITKYTENSSISVLIPKEKSIIG